jgi:3-isopropylmalate dehydrogenase
MTSTFRITLLPGDGIGPEIMAVTVDVLKTIGQQMDLAFEFQEALIGGAAIDETGSPLPDETLKACKGSDAILLAAIGGYKWDNLPRHQRPETGLLGLRAGLELFANLRPATILPQLSRCLFPEAGSRGGGRHHGGARTYRRHLLWGAQGSFDRQKLARSGGSTPWPTPRKRVDRIGKVAFATAQKRGEQLCSVDKANVLEVSQLWRDRITALAPDYSDVELAPLCRQCRHAADALAQAVRHHRYGEPVRRYSV